MHPYKHLADDKFWRKHLNSIKCLPTTYSCFSNNQDLSSLSVMTFGSCFAENIIPYLHLNGITYTKTEDSLWYFTGGMAEDKIGYATFSCEYGNIYTPQQAFQLFDELNIGLARELISGWQVSNDGSIVDLLRPGYPYRSSRLEEFANRRRLHRQKCVEAVQTSSHIFITLGMAEAWMDKNSGLVLPACPGTVGGEFDPEKFKFCEFSHNELVYSLDALVKRLLAINPDIFVVLTVSPIPMIATASSDMTVLESNFYAKSKLISAAREVIQNHASVSYFPSYELIISDAFGIQSFGADGRTINREVLDRIFSLMFASLHSTDSQNFAVDNLYASNSPDPPPNLGSFIANLECEEAIGLKDV